MTLKEDIPPVPPYNYNIILLVDNTKTRNIHTTNSKSTTTTSSSLCNKDKFKKLLYTCARANYYFNIFTSLSHLSTIMASSSSLSVSPSPSAGFQLLALGLDMDPFMRCCKSNNMNPTPNSQKKNRKKKNKRKNKQNNHKPQQKQVHFDEENMVVVIEFVDDEESAALRKCYWEFFATDRSRFKDRISQTNEAIGHCFSPEHRDTIYRERFQEDLLLPVVPVQEKEKGGNDADERLELE